MNESNQKTQCLGSRELYQRILSEIKERAQKKSVAPYIYIVELGFQSKQYYTIKKFTEGKTLDNGMTRPMNDTNLSILMKSLGFKLRKTMYLVDF